VNSYFAGAFKDDVTWCFNPHPSLLTGELIAMSRAFRGIVRFNPHPSLLTGEFRVKLLNGRVLVVSIHTRHC